MNRRTFLKACGAAMLAASSLYRIATIPDKPTPKAHRFIGVVASGTYSGVIETELGDSYYILTNASGGGDSYYSGTVIGCLKDGSE